MTHMNGRVVLDIQTRAEGERLYVRYNTDANGCKALVIPNGCKRLYLSKILEIGMILGEKIERKVYVNPQNFGSDMQLLIKHSFLLSFLHELLTVLQVIDTMSVRSVWDLQGEPL